MDAYVEVKDNINAQRNLKLALQFIRDNQVLVGIPQKNNSRTVADQTTKPIVLTNAELMFIHSNGSPVNHIPARPSIEPAVYADRDRLSRMFREAFKMAARGDISGAQAQLEKIGIRGQNVSRAWFTNPENGWAPNSPATLRYKAVKHGIDPDSESAQRIRPLIDTGALRASITYVVRRPRKF